MGARDALLEDILADGYCRALLDRRCVTLRRRLPSLWLLVKHQLIHVSKALVIAGRRLRRRLHLRVPVIVYLIPVRPDLDIRGLHVVIASIVRERRFTDWIHDLDLFFRDVLVGGKIAGVDLSIGIRQRLRRFQQRFGVRIFLERTAPQTCLELPLGFLLRQ